MSMPYLKCSFSYLFLQFIGVVHAILTSGKQLQKLYVESDAGYGASQQKNVKSSLLRRLISTAASPTVMSHAVKLLSSLNKDAADQGDMLNLFISCTNQFPEVRDYSVGFNYARL